MVILHVCNPGLANVGREDFAQERSGVQCAGVPGLTDECEPCIYARPPYDEFHRKMGKMNGIGLVFSL